MADIFEADIAGDDGILLPSFVLANLVRPKDPARRDQLYHSLCAYFIRERGARDADWASQPQRLLPMHAARPEATISADMRSFDRHIQHRITAGHIAMAFILEVDQGKNLTLPKGVKRLSFNQMAESVSDDVQINDVGNIRRRVWQPSAPVLHLCAGLAATLQQVRKSQAPARTITADFADTAFLTSVLSLAQTFEEKLAKSRLRTDPARLVRFRMLEKRGQ